VDLFEAVTGERIQPGVRCERCDGRGERVTFWDIPAEIRKCVSCQGTGYEVLPSWMEERA
jgi:DnaJ-class molecular chaperone